MEPSAAADGEATVLVTDLERFTEVIERLGDAPALELLREHNRILRRCLYEHDGQEIAHTGDGLIAAFARTESALCCAARMQHQMLAFNCSEPEAKLGVRIGVHSGRVLYEEGRLFGRCVNLTVRVCALARPGTVLISESVADRTNAGFGRNPIGAVALKGIREAQSLFELDWQHWDPASECHRRRYVDTFDTSEGVSERFAQRSHGM